MNFKFDKQKIKKYESFSLEEVYEERNVNALGIVERACRLRNKCERSGYDRRRNLLI